ncbi:hypothetical protein D3C78_1311760 [compost metagenome]
MRGLIHVHRADQNQVGRIGDGAWHAIHVGILSMQLDVVTSLHSGQQWRQVLLGVRKVHLVQHQRVWLRRIGTGSQQKIESLGSDVGVAVQRIDVAQQACGVMPTRLHRHYQQTILRRVGVLPKAASIATRKLGLACAAEAGQHGKMPARVAPQACIQLADQLLRELDVRIKALDDSRQR